MPSAKHRQHSPSRPVSKSQLPTIASFAKVTKPSKTQQPSCTKSTLPETSVGVTQSLASGVKRKRESEEPSGEKPRAKLNRSGPAQPTSNGLLTPETTPVKAQKWSVEAPLKRQVSETITPPSTPTKRETVTRGDELPQDVEDLISMNSSLLKALSLHMAHNGVASPIDACVLTASLAQVWRKRKSTVDDVRLCLGGLGASSPFILVKYSRNKVCLEWKIQPDMSRIAAPVDEERLGDIFEQRLRKRWAAFAEPTTGDTFIHFIEALPRAPISASTSLDAVRPSLEKGQRRLKDLLGVAKSNQSQATTMKSNTSSVAKDTKMRGTSLLDRLRAKDAAAAARGPALNKAQVERQRTLNRAEEVVNILNAPSRSTGTTKHTYSMSEVVETVQDSAKATWSDEDISGTLRLLAEEGPSGFVRVVRTSRNGDSQGPEAVVVDLSRRVTSTDLRTWVAAKLDGIRDWKQ